MIGYVTLGTNDLKQAESFYNELFEVIGIKQMFKTEKWWHGVKTSTLRYLP